MFNFGWAELLIIAVVLVLVVGPKELPVIMRALGRVVRRFQYMRYAVTRQFDDLLKDAELDDLRRQARMQAHGDSQAEQDDDELYFREDDNENRRDQ